MGIVTVIGAGLAGSEAAWQLAQRGHRVRLHEMRPLETTPAHESSHAAEMVCSNSFKSDDPASATGILKAELKRLDSMVLACAEATRVPAGNSLAVDREAFATAVTQSLKSHPNIEWIPGRVDAPNLDAPTILATGPLSAPGITAWLSEQIGGGELHFYDAIAPIVEADSIDLAVAFKASRYDKGGADFLNCPMDQLQYEAFLEALLAAPKVELHHFETPFFEACLPIEVMAARGPETLRFGPMKPKGLKDPRTGHMPYAAVQLRQDTLAADHFNMVGFQTRLKWPAQQEVFRLIPGLEQASFARLGSIHRNTYLHAPSTLDSTLAVKSVPGLWIAGQLSGVEGYLESTASGLATALFVHNMLQGREARPLPRETVLGALLHYLAHCEAKVFSPVNAMLGLLPELPEGTLDIRTLKRSGGTRAVKQGKGLAHRARALASLEAYLA